jgi:hypothetical protein
VEPLYRSWLQILHYQSTTSTCASTCSSSTSISRCSHLQKKARTGLRSLDRGGGNQRGKKRKEEINPEPKGRREQETHRRLQPELLLAGGRRLVRRRRAASLARAGACVRPSSARQRGCCLCVAVGGWVRAWNRGG